MDLAHAARGNYNM